MQRSDLRQRRQQVHAHAELQVRSRYLYLLQGVFLLSQLPLRRVLFVRRSLPETKHHGQSVEQKVTRGGLQRTNARLVPGTDRRTGPARTLAHVHVSSGLRHVSVRTETRERSEIPHAHCRRRDTPAETERKDSELHRCIYGSM